MKESFNGQFQVCKMKSSGGWLHNKVNIFNITELYSQKMVKVVNLMYISPQLKNPPLH